MELRKVPSILWKVQIPINDVKLSPVFTVMDCEWRLKLTYVSNYVKSLSNLYRLSIIKCSEINTFKSLFLTTYVHTKVPYISNEHFNYVDINISDSSGMGVCIWESEVDDLKAVASDNYLSIVCLFIECTDLMLSTDKSQGDDSTLPAHDSTSETKINLGNSKTTSITTLQNPSSYSTVFPFGLPTASLSSPTSFEISTQPISRLFGLPDLTTQTSLHNSVFTGKQNMKLLDSSLNYESLSMDLCNLLDQKLMADVQLRSGDITIPAHKAVLSARSEVFAAMFRDETVESDNSSKHIKDIESSVFSAFLKYLYSGKFSENVSEDMVPKLYVAGSIYAVYTLKKVCSNFMVKNMNKENFVNFLKLADAHKDEELKNAVANFVLNRTVLLTKDIWLNFTEEQPKLALEIYRKYVTNSVSVQNK